MATICSAYFTCILRSLLQILNNWSIHWVVSTAFGFIQNWCVRLLLRGIHVVLFKDRFFNCILNGETFRRSLIEVYLLNLTLRNFTWDSLSLIKFSLRLIGSWLNRSLILSWLTISLYCCGILACFRSFTHHVLCVLILISLFILDLLSCIIDISIWINLFLATARRGVLLSCAV